MFLVKGVEIKQPGDQDQGIKGDQCQDPGQKWKPDFWEWKERLMQHLKGLFKNEWMIV